jgi:hypothetical protein
VILAVLALLVVVRPTLVPPAQHLFMRERRRNPIPARPRAAGRPPAPVRPARRGARCPGRAHCPARGPPKAAARAAAGCPSCRQPTSRAGNGDLPILPR